MIFYNFPREGAMKNRLQKRGKKKRTVPTTSAGGQYPPYLPLLSFGFHPSSTFSCIYTYILLLTPPRFHKRRGIEMMGVLYSFSLLDSLSPLIYFYIILLQKEEESYTEKCLDKFQVVNAPMDQVHLSLSPVRCRNKYYFSRDEADG